MMRLLGRVALVLVGGFVLAILANGRAEACGGLFCQNSPVDQVGERIVFTVNDDGTVSALIEIQYTGSAPDFSWILPVAGPIGSDALAVPDDGDLVFEELHRLTDVRIIAPPNNCDSGDGVVATSAEEDGGGVEVFGSGEVGPFSFDIVGSEDPDALITWLRDNEYRVEPFMEPLIDVYVEEAFLFVAMRLIEGEDVDSIQPIEITYPGEDPMIPLRLTAVAARPEMPVWTWVFADAQAVPENYQHMEIETAELTFSGFGANDYVQLVQRRADALGGQAFITEFAGPANSIDLQHQYLRERRDRYLTRLTTYISPDEMTVDPVFGFNPNRDNVSNVRDASRLDGLWDCERGGLGWFSLTSNDAIDPYRDDGTVAPFTPGKEANVALSWLLVLGLPAVIAFGVVVRRSRRAT